MVLDIRGVRIGWGITGSHCSYEEVLPQIECLIKAGAQVQAVISPAVAQTDTRFGKAADLIERVTQLTGLKPLTTIAEVEPAGQKKEYDCFLVAPCTGNTLAKLIAGITDTAVLMACKGTLRNLQPVVLAISTNDALGNNARNIGMLLGTRNIFLVPLGQDNPTAKPGSCVADFSLIPDTIIAALKGCQLQPVLRERRKREVR